MCYRQCETCCCDSEDDLKPSRAPDGATSSRSGRAINRPSAYKQSEETQLQVAIANCTVCYSGHGVAKDGPGLGMYSFNFYALPT